MRCAWQAYLSLIPVRMRCEIDHKYQDTLQEVRMRINKPPELICTDRRIQLNQLVTDDDLSFSINMASEYSPWTSNTAQLCYITAPGGHRIGICGSIVSNDGYTHGYRNITSISIRVARDVTGIVTDILPDGSVLILGRPGSGKTTLLRELIRRRSDTRYETISVIDERGEIFPIVNGSFCFQTGMHVDVLTGQKKAEGIENLLRTMTPDTIAVDEITASADTSALLNAAWCGVELIATAHADSVRDFKTRPVYKPLVDNGIFKYVMILRRDKSWYWEKME